MKKETRRYLICYTLIFLITFFFSYLLWFIIYNKSFIRGLDEFSQHYVGFINTGSWLRKILKNIFINHKFIVPLWSNSIGFGSDILISKGAYIPDLFNYISVFFPKKYSEIGFSLMLFLKLYTSGLAFSYFAKYRGYSKKTSLIGSILYSFSFYSTLLFTESFFINNLYIMPILIVGVDKLIKDDNPKVYFIALLISFINYLYFSYMMCIIVIIYFLITYFINSDTNKSLKKFFKLVFKFLFYSVLALLGSAFVTFPIISNLFSQSRIGIKSFLPILYNASWYKSLFSGFLVGTPMSFRDEFMGLGAFTLTFIIYLFTIKGKYKKEKLEFIIATISLLIPLFGYFMNGFSYYANRWDFIYPLICVNIACIVLENLDKIDKKKSYITLTILLIYELLNILIKNTGFDMSFEILLCFIIVIVMLKDKDKNKLILLSILSAITLNLFTYTSFSKTKYRLSYNYLLEGSGINLLNNINNIDGTRYDSNVDRIYNASSLISRSGYDFYSSMYNENIDKFLTNICLVSIPWKHAYIGLDSRSELEALMGTKYFITDNKDHVPIGFNKKIKDTKYKDKTYNLYKSDYKTSIIHLFDKKVDYKTYMKLDSFDRYKALSKYIVLDSNKSSNVSFKDDSVKYNTKLNNISLNKKNYKVHKKGYIELIFDDIKRDEVYLYIDKLNYNYKDLGAFNFKIKIYDDNNVIGSKMLYGTNNKSHMYGDKHNYLINLGRIKKANKIRIYLDKGNYNINNIKIYERKISDIENTIKSLDTGNSKVKYSTNRYDINVNLDKCKYALISVPYSKGWNAYVDGKKVKLKKADDAFMEFYLNKGKHKIVLKYETPYLKLGLIISLICIIIFIGIGRKHG